MRTASNLAKEATQAHSAALNRLKPAGIKLTCDKFDGCKDRYQYQQWFAQFTAMIEASSVDDDKYKLSQLMAHLNPGSLAMGLIADYKIIAENYPLAINDLEKEFRDKDRNRSDLFLQLLNKFPSYDITFEGTRIYLG